MFIYNNLWSKIKTFKSIPKLFVEKFIELFYRTYYSEDVKELLLNKTIIEDDNIPVFVDIAYHTIKADEENIVVILKDTSIKLL